MMRRTLVCFACVCAAGVCTALDQAQFDADVHYMTNEILTGTIRHVRDIVYPGLDGFQKWRGLSDEDFTRELLFIASMKRLNGTETEREVSRKTGAWRQTMVYLCMRNIPLKESIDFYESILRSGTADEMFHTVYNYAALVGCTREYLKNTGGTGKTRHSRIGRTLTV